MYNAIERDGRRNLCRDGKSLQSTEARDKGSDGNGQDVPQISVVVQGREEVGKTTLIGVLTSGMLDNGCGLARHQVLFTMECSSMTG